MGSMSNPNPWSPYDPYNDCSQGICNIYCPQWCYLIFPPPPPSFFSNESDDSSSSSNFSPLLIALIGILTSAFVLVSYYTLISKYCHRHHENSPSSEAPNTDHGGGGGGGGGIFSSRVGDGLNEAMIKSITVYKYRKIDGFIDGSDCSVCLSEFEENESLRLLPKCNHAFHLPCIDTWLKSHSNCPLCRAFVTGVNNPTTVTEAGSVVRANRGGENAEANLNINGYQNQTGGDSVGVIEDLEIRSRDSSGRSELRFPEEEQGDVKDEDPQVIRRSVSLNSGLVVSIADVLREIEDEEESAGVGTSHRRNENGDGKTEVETVGNQRSGVSNFLVRSLSTGRFIFSRYDRGRNYRLPN